MAAKKPRRVAPGPAGFNRKGAILVADLCGFTKTMLAKGPRATLRRIDSMRKTVIPVLNGHDAEVYKIEADNLYAFFESAENAVEGAIASHRALRRLGPNGPKISIGIGFGTLLYIPAEDEYYGAELNLASKLGEDIGAGGDVLATQDVVDQIVRAKFALKRRRATVSGLQFTYYRIKN